MVTLVQCWWGVVSLLGELCMTKLPAMACPCTDAKGIELARVIRLVKISYCYQSGQPMLTLKSWHSPTWLWITELIWSKSSLNDPVTLLMTTNSMHLLLNKGCPSAPVVGKSGAKSLTLVEDNMWWLLIKNKPAILLFAHMEHLLWVHNMAWLSLPTNVHQPSLHSTGLEVYVKPFIKLNFMNLKGGALGFEHLLKCMMLIKMEGFCLSKYLY